MTVDLTAAEFHDADKARDWLEAAPLAERPVLPALWIGQHVARMGGNAHRPGLFHCPDCRGQFTVLTGSVMERSHVPLAKWVLGLSYLMAASKKGIWAHQLHRMLEDYLKTTWFMCASYPRGDRGEKPVSLGGEGNIVEADEMYHGKRETPAELSRGRIRKPTKGGKLVPLRSARSSGW